MPTIHFRGRVIPQHYAITIEGLPQVTSQEIDTGENITLSVKIVESRVFVECTVDRYVVGGDISRIHTRATHFARAIVDCFGFANGFGLIVLLDEMEDVDGVVKSVVYLNEELARHFTAFRDPDGSINYREMFLSIVTDPHLCLAINDLIVAVTVPGNIAIGCARAVESLRNIIVPEDGQRNQGWAELRRVLRLEQGYVEFITASSAGPRHGSDRYLPNQETHAEVMKRTWTIMNRYLIYRRLGNQPLPVDEFPVLT